MRVPSKAREVKEARERSICNLRHAHWAAAIALLKGETITPDSPIGEKLVQRFNDWRVAHNLPALDVSEADGL